MGILKMVKSHNFTRILKKYDVEACYLFGSHARNKTTPLSDIDIAILLSDEVQPCQLANLQIEITAELTSFLQRNDVDLVILNNAYPSVCFKAVSSGNLLFENNRGKRIAAEIKIRRIYFDMSHLRNVLNAGMEKRLA